MGSTNIGSTNEYTPPGPGDASSLLAGSSGRREIEEPRPGAVSGFSISRLWATAPHRASAGLRRVLDLVAEGRLDIPITDVGSLTDVPPIHQLLAEGRGNGKYVAHLER